jgi:L-amino acid N-acyltransferase YncA
MIRLATKEDASQIAAIYRPYCEDNSVSFETEAPAATEMAARIEKIRQKHPWLVEDIDGTVAGYVYASPHRVRSAYRWVVEVTIYIDERFQGRGIGRSLYIELFRLLRDQGYFRAYAGILIPNAASQGFHESMGFTLVGTYEKVGFKLGNWRDVGWWQLVLQPQSGAPDEPRRPVSRLSIPL